MTPRDVRAAIPALEDATYLNFGAHGPSPRPVVAAADQFTRSHEYESPTGGDPFEYATGARRFEVGSANPAPHVALREAIDVIQDVGVGRLQDRIRTLATLLGEHVPDSRLHSPLAPESGLVTIDVDDPEATVERLASEGIVVRALPHPDAIRVSVHGVNTRPEIDRLIESLEREWG